MKEFKRSRFQLILIGVGAGTYQKKLGDIGVGEKFLGGGGEILLYNVNAIYRGVWYLNKFDCFY